MRNCWYSSYLLHVVCVAGCFYCHEIYRPSHSWLELWLPSQRKSPFLKKFDEPTDPTVPPSVQKGVYALNIDHVLLTYNCRFWSSEATTSFYTQTRYNTTFYRAKVVLLQLVYLFLRFVVLQSLVFLTVTSRGTCLWTRLSESILIRNQKYAQSLN